MEHNGGDLLEPTLHDSRSVKFGYCVGYAWLGVPNFTWRVS